VVKRVKDFLLSTKEDLQESFSIKGRLSRMQFLKTLFGFLIAIVLYEVFIVGFPAMHLEKYGLGENTIFNITVSVLMLLPVIPLACTAIKRLHDIGQRGYLIIIVFIPYVNILFLLALFLIPGQKDANRFAPPSKRDKNPIYIIGGWIYDVWKELWPERYLKIAPPLKQDSEVVNATRESTCILCSETWPEKYFRSDELVCKYCTDSADAAINQTSDRYDYIRITRKIKELLKSKDYNLPEAFWNVDDIRNLSIGIRIKVRDAVAKEHGYREVIEDKRYEAEIDELIDAANSTLF